MAQAQGEHPIEEAGEESQVCGGAGGDELEGPNCGVRTLPNLLASVATQMGSRHSMPRIVEMANWLPVEPMRSLRPGVSISFLFSLERKAAKRLATHAEKRASTEKSSSLSEARHTPPMTGIRHSHLALDTVFP